MTNPCPETKRAMACEDVRDSIEAWCLMTLPSRKGSQEDDVNDASNVSSRYGNISIME